VKQSTQKKNIPQGCDFLLIVIRHFVKSFIKSFYFPEKIPL
jgi:hypothetical protein